MARKITSAEQKVLAEYALRKNMAVNVFRPLPNQDWVFTNQCFVALVRGGNRCIAAGTVFVKESGDTCLAEEISVGDKVLGVDGDMACYTEVTAIRSFEEGAYEVVLDCGICLTGTSDHPVRTKTGWAEVSDLKAGDDVQCFSVEDGDFYWSKVSRIGYAGIKQFFAVTTNSETYISNGIVSHNSGKSTTCAVRCGAAAMDLPVTLSDGKTQVHCRRPHQRGKPLVIWIIGYDWMHIGTIYELLFKGGLFGVIYDKDLCEYRAWRPEDGEENKKPSPPVIPSRYINPDSWAWENKKLRHFRKVEIWNPQTKETLATIYTWPSTADAKAGDIVDIIWIDEKIENADHFDEWKARLTDRRGHLFWSSWPTTENDALRKISEQAETERDLPNPKFGECILKFSDNKALPDDVIQDRLASFTTEEERMARDLGEYITGLTKMYPEFSEYEHDVYAIEDDLAKELRKHGGNIPPDWTRELILDPGTAHPAVLFGAIPPPRFGDYLIVYDEVSVTQVPAVPLAQKYIKPKSRGYKFNRFIIDEHASRQTPMGFGHTVGKQYKDAFESAGVFLQNDRVYFVPGCDNVSARISEVQRALNRDNGPPRLRIITKNCPELVKQMKRYLKRTIKKEVEEFHPAPRQQIDVATCLEYWIASHPRYSRPKILSKPVADMNDFEFDEAFFNGSHRKKKPSKGSGIIGPSYSVR